MDQLTGPGRNEDELCGRGGVGPRSRERSQDDGTAAFPVIVIVSVMRFGGAWVLGPRH